MIVKSAALALLAALTLSACGSANAPAASSTVVAQVAAPTAPAFPVPAKKAAVKKESTVPVEDTGAKDAADAAEVKADAAEAKAAAAEKDAAEAKADAAEAKADAAEAKADAAAAEEASKPVYKSCEYWDGGVKKERSHGWTETQRAQAPGAYDYATQTAEEGEWYDNTTTCNDGKFESSSKLSRDQSDGK